MSKKYFCAYYSYLDSMETLTDEERGRLFTACLIYGKTGQVPDLPGHEKHVFPSFKSQIDRDNKEYDSYCESQKERAKKRWNASACQGMQTDANEKEKEKEKEKENITSPLTPQGEAEQSESLKVEKAKGTAKAVNHSKTSVQIRFQSFWEAYPKKKAKGDALKAFNKLNPDDGLMEKMLSALEWQKKSFDWTKDGGQYIPLPASWIRGMRWEDEPETAVKKEGRQWKILD